MKFVLVEIQFAENYDVRKFIGFDWEEWRFTSQKW